MRHSEIRVLWLQSTGEKKLLVEMVYGPKNPTDMLTKIESIEIVDDLLKLTQVRACRR